MPTHVPNATHTSDATSTLLGPVKPVKVPELRVIAITSLNGSLSLEGVSGNLGNDLDQALLAKLRHWADAILVTARTAEIERYQPPQCPPEIEQLRTQRKQSPQPQLVLLSRDIEKYLSMPLIKQKTVSIVFLTPSDSEDIPPKEVLEEHRLQVLLYDANRPASIREVLHRAGYSRITCEGGPNLYDFLLKHGLVDLLHLTIAPTISAPISHSLTQEDSKFTQKLSLEHIFTDSDGLLFTRYRVS